MRKRRCWQRLKKSFSGRTHYQAKRPSKMLGRFVLLLMLTAAATSLTNGD